MSDLPPRSPPGDDDDINADFDLAAEPVRATPPPPAGDESRKLADLRARVYATMQKRHTIDAPMAWGLIGGGAAILLVVGIVLSVVLWFLGAMLFDDPPGFRFWFFLYFVALVPLLVWEERRTRGGFFTLAIADVDLTRDPENVGDFLLHRSTAHVTAIAHGLMWAPRAIVAGFRALRGVREAGLDRVLPEAADLLTLMLSLDGGVKIKDLAPPGEDPSQLMPVLKWLDQHDYIGTSTRGDRVWVSTFAKKRLAADHGAAIPMRPGAA